MSTYQKVKKYKKVKEELSNILNREPVNEELEQELNESINGLEVLTIDENEEKELELKVRICVWNNNLLKTRKEKDLKQSDVAKLLGISSVTYSVIETCKIYPKQEIQEKISEIFNKPKEYLFPKWLQIFTNNWKRVEREKLVKLDTINLEDPQVLSLTSPDTIDMFEKAQNEILKPKISGALDCLDPKERKIIEMRFGFYDGVSRTYDEVAARFEVTRERIRQIEAKALEKLRIELNYLNEK